MLGMFTNIHLEKPIYDHSTERSTMIWFTKKKRWRKGPVLPNKVSYHHFCSTPLNSSSVLFAFVGDITLEMKWESTQSIKEMAIFDFHTKQWIEISRMNVEAIHVTCTMTTVFKKQGKQTALLMINGNYNQGIFLI